MEIIKKAITYLDGKKTYIVSVVIAALAIYLFSTQQITFEQLIELLGISGIGAGLHAQTSRLGKGR